MTAGDWKPASIFYHQNCRRKLSAIKNHAFFQSLAAHIESHLLILPQQNRLNQ